MAYQDQPPPYSPPDTPAITTQITIGVTQQMGYNEGRQDFTNDHITRSPESTQNDTIRHIVGIKNASNSFSGFIDVMNEQRKLPWSFIKSLAYRVALIIYYFENFTYSIIFAAVQGDHLAYYLIYIIVSLTGVVVELIIVIVYIRKQWIQSSSEEGPTQSRLNQVAHTSRPREAWTADTQVQHYYHTAGSLLKEYVLLSLGEFLIHPTLICNLVGLINEGRNFDNLISTHHFLFFVYGVLMDAFYLKFCVIWLVIRVVHATYKKYDELVQPSLVEWKRFFTPVYLTIPFAIVTALTSWFMIGLIGVRIYVDNFTPMKNNTNSSIQDTGDYRVAPFTGFMIACTIYLPIVSWITYIILNKAWFYEVYSAINQLGNGANQMPMQDTWDQKLFAYVKDPLAYIAAIFLMAPFIGFAVGAFPVDYDSSEYDVVSSARDALEGLASCYFVFFVLSNIQATIVILLMVPFTCVLLILGIVACYKCIKG